MHDPRQFPQHAHAEALGAARLRIASLQAATSRKQRQIEAGSRQIASLQNELKFAPDEISRKRLERTIANTQGAIEASRANIKTLERQLEQARAELTALDAPMSGNQIERSQYVGLKYD